MDGNIKEFNSAYREMLGYSEAELMGVTYFGLTPEKWHSMEAKIVKEQVLVKGYSDVYEKEYRKKNGIIFPISLRTYLIKDAYGKPQGMWAFVRDISKRKEMEATLLKARDELEMRVQERTKELTKAYEEMEEQSRILDSFFKYTITPLVLLDRDFNFIRVNQAYAETCQRDISEFPGHNHFEFYPHKENEEIFRRVVETKLPFQTFAKPFAFPDHPEWGVSYWDWTLTPLLDTMGEVEFLVFSLNNVTDRKKVEMALHDSELWMRCIFNSLEEAILIVTPDRIIKDINMAAQKMFGYTKEEFPNHTTEVLHVDYDHYLEFGRRISEAFDKGESANFEFKAKRRSGEIFPTEHTVSLLKNDMGEAIGIVSVVRDITERKQVEDSLREREALLRTVFETLPVGVWITDKQGRIMRGNPAGQQIWAGARFVGIDQFEEYKGWWVDTGKRIEPEEWAAARAVLKGETSINEEIEIECFDGSHKIILNSAAPIRDERQEILGAFIVNQDITGRKRAEKTIRQMQKMEALGTLAGGIAHDFNNILMPIVINTELALLDTPDSSPVLNYLKLIQEAANRGKDLIKQIITFSRQKEQVKAPVEIGPIIKEALKFLRSSIPKSIEIREQIEAAPSITFADPTQIHQILMNLCSNAAYAMREKGGILDVSLTAIEVDADMTRRHMELNPGSYIRLTVSDTGHGMDKEIMDKAFDPFFTTKKPGEGAGMGLAVVHGIVKNHGGAITVYSEVGKGSTFNIFLPMMKSERKNEIPSSEPISMGNERILLIDDEDIQIRSVQPMLERLGYKVIGKTDAIQALEIFRAQPDTFDLVITDQTMPHMTGRELAEEFLRIRPNIPVILCTGFSEVIHEEEAKAMGIRGFIMKPFSLKEVAGIIRKSLERNG
jgi:PAS domain S-box-containing protein